MYYLYSWSNLKKDSPEESTRNDWLWRYGAFGRYRGLWFPCRITSYNTIGNPATVIAVPTATRNMNIYPEGEVSVEDMEVLYSTFADGRSIFAYTETHLIRKGITDQMLNSAIKRSLNTEIVYAPKQMVRAVKQAVNRFAKAETFVVDNGNKDQIGTVELPRTIDIVEKLWNSNDWALQEICQHLGMSYNPSAGKKERMLNAEMLGDRDITVMNRRLLTQRLVVAAEKFGEKVNHISTEIDVIDRGLSYGGESVDGSLGEKSGLDNDETGNNG